MPEFDPSSCHKYWHEYKDLMIYRVVTFMEGVEHWTLDGDPKVENSMTKLGKVMEDIGNIDLKLEENFIKLCAYIKANRMLRVMQCMDTAHPGAASKLLTYAEQNSKSSDDVPGLFLRRNIVFERLRLLGRVFSPDRLALILKSLEEETYV